MGKFKQCPRCQKETAAFLKIETGMRLGLNAANMGKDLPDQVCPPCYQDLAQHVSEGARLRAEQKAKEANRQNMWANRVALIKQGRELMTHRAFSEAAVAYEKYLRIVEIVHEVGPGEISPELFKNSSKNKELTVIASVYWDLLRIYDSSPAHVSRQVTAAKKLAEFARHTPIFSDIAKRTMEFRKKAKNKEPFEIFMRTANIRSQRCFIASSTFNSNHCHEVRQLCRFPRRNFNGKRPGNKTDPILLPLFSTNRRNARS